MKFKKKPAKFTNSSEKFQHYILIEILIVEN